MKVLIVAKTHMMGEFCVGGLARDTNQNVRLMQPGGLNQPVDTAYEVGQVWDLAFTPALHLRPPHVEDVIVEQSRYLGKVRDIKQTLLERVKIWQGGPENLFDGLIRFTEEGGSGYISAKTDIPQQSVGFWLTDRVLTPFEQRQKIRYHTPGYQVKITYVGIAEPVDMIPAGALLRVSLARWWQPYERLDIESRCYLQLSGWYL